MTPAQIAEAQQRMARLAEWLRAHLVDCPEPECATCANNTLDAAALTLAQQALAEWVSREAKTKALEWAESAGMRDESADLLNERLKPDVVESLRKRAKRDMLLARRLLKLED